MPEPKTGGNRERIAATILYGMICALEVQGYRAVLAGKSVLELPFSWKVAFCAFCVWWCWETFRKEHGKNGVLLAAFTVLLGAFTHLKSMGHFLQETFAGHKILEPPSEGTMLLYALFAGLCLWIACRQKLKSGIRISGTDRCAALLMALLFATKIGMRFVTGHDAIALKGAGCAAVCIGFFAMILGFLDATSSGEPEFPAIQDALP
jgi:hypothetical protein